MPITGLLEQARLRQPVFPELADGLEEAVPGARAAVVGDHERLPDQRIEQTEHVDIVGAVDHGTGAHQVEAAREHRRQAEQFALVFGEEVIGPLHGMAERVLSFRPRLRGLQQPEAVREPTPDLDSAHGRHPRRGQFDPQWEAVEGSTDLGHGDRGLGLPEAEVGPHDAGAVHEQRDGIGGDTPVQRQRRHGQRRLLVDRQGLTRRGEELGVA